jgi:hypothetical protein
MKRVENLDYRDKNKIVSLFNESVSAYKVFCGHPEDDCSRDTMKHLGDAGVKLYRCFEIALKHVLAGHMHILQKKGLITWPECRNRIEGYYDRSQKRQIDGILGMNRPALVRLHETESPEAFYKAYVNFRVIEENAKKLSNKIKHLESYEDKGVLSRKYCEVLPEIAKYITAYVKHDAKLAPISLDSDHSPLQAKRLFNDTEYFNSDGRSKFALLIDSVSDLPEEQRKVLTIIKWSMVLDLDPDSRMKGLEKAFIAQHHVEPVRFDPTRPHRTIFNKFAKTPYWFFLNGISGLNDTLTDGTMRSWLRKYGNHLPETFTSYHASFESPIRLVVLSEDAERVSEIVKKLDSIYGDKFEVLLLSTNHPTITENKNVSAKMYPLTAGEFARSILSILSLFSNESRSFTCKMPDKDGVLQDVNAEEYSHFELVHYNIADDDANSPSKTEPEMFYKGIERLSWYGAKNGFAIERNVARMWLEKQIRDMSDSYGTFQVFHDPGIGGSTFAISFAYDMRKSRPVCILRQYIKEITVLQLVNLYKTLRASILILIDSSVLNRDQVASFESELKPEAFPFVIVYTKRTTSRQTNKLSFLDDSEYKEMLQRLEPFTTKETLDKLKVARQKEAERSPFFMSLYTFEDDFKGITPYIRTFIHDMTEEQKNR